MPGPVARADRTTSGLSRALLLGLVCCLLGSCTATLPSAPPSLEAPSTASAEGRATPAEVKTTLDALAAAIRGHHRSAFDRLISPRDPDFTPVASRIYDNLSGAPLTALTFQQRPQLYDLTPSRRELLGADASVLAVSVSWRLVGDSGPADHLLWFTVVGAGSDAAVAATTDGPADRVAQPFWLLEPLTAQRAGRTTVLSGRGASTADWIHRGNAAIAAIRPRLPSHLRSPWNGDLVIEIPSTGQIFEQLLGVTPGSYAQIAAVAWPEGSQAAVAALRVVVNPGVADRLDDESLEILLTHEATHVATRSAASQAPTWLVEGFADYVAYDAYPRTAAAAAAALLADVKARGVPMELPADSLFSPLVPGLALTYARSWLVCRYLAEHDTAARLDRFYAEVDSGTPVDESARRVFGFDESQLIAGWGGYLRSLADDT